MHAVLGRVFREDSHPGRSRGLSGGPERAPAVRQLRVYSWHTRVLDGFFFRDVTATGGRRTVPDWEARQTTSRRLFPYTCCAGRGSMGL